MDTPAWLKALGPAVAILTLLSGAWPPGDSVPATYVLDPFLTAADTVAAHRFDGDRVLCHLRAGLVERDRPDVGRFPAEVAGLPTSDGRARWLDVRQWDLVGSVLSDRVELCAVKGFAEVLFSDVDGYLHDTGFPITAADQATFIQALIDTARRHGVAVASG